jgi:LPXTG-motif cell wall-anchored protein
MSKKVNKYVYAAAALGMLLGTANPSLVSALSNDTAPAASEANPAETTSQSSTETQQSETTTSETSEQSTETATSTEQSTEQSSEQTTDQTADQTPPAETNSADSKAAVNDNDTDKAEIAKIGKGDKFNPDLFLKFTERKLHEAYDSKTDFIFKTMALQGAVKDLIKPENVKERFDVAPETVNHLVAAYFMYDAAFAKDSLLFSILASMNNEVTPNTGFYPDTEQLEGTTLNRQDGKMMTVKSYYVNHKSDKTVIIHGGVRGNWNNGLVSDEYKDFYDAGYNLLFVDSRASGASGGDYITYGAYESDDVLYWINRESRERPQQKILLYGGSMGAATMMSTLAKNIPANVKGIIENCGFKSINEQLRFTYQSKIAPALNYLFGGLDVNTDQAHEDMYMSMLQQYYNDPYVKIDLSQDLPVLGMTNTTIPKLIIHGSADSVVPVSNAQALYDLASGYKDLLIVEGADHGKAQEVDPVAYNQHVTDFLKVVFDDQVQVRYQDEQGKSLIDKDCLVLSGAYGDPYKAEAKTFDGYKLISTEGPTEGTFNEKIATITYTYQKQAVKPDDNSGNNDNKGNPSGTKDDTPKTEPVKEDTPKAQNISKADVNVHENKPSAISAKYVPLKESASGKLPKTGDTTHPAAMIAGGVISAAALFFWFIKARKGLKK